MAGDEAKTNLLEKSDEHISEYPDDAGFGNVRVKQRFESRRNLTFVLFTLSSLILNVYLLAEKRLFYQTVPCLAPYSMVPSFSPSEASALTSSR